MDQCEDYWNAITIIEAQEMLKAMKVSAYPHMEREEQQNSHREIHRQAFPAIWQESKELTLEEISAIVERFNV